jgi:pilus assembly protein Flp/PilA
MRVGVDAREVPVKNLITRMRALMRDDSGQDLLEYALLVALIALVAVAAVTNSGQAVNSIFTTVASRLQQAAQAAGA